MLATTHNMRRIWPEDRHLDTPNGPVVILSRKPVAWSPDTQEVFSANPGDYFWQPDDEPLRDREGNPMLLAFERHGFEVVDDG